MQMDAEKKVEISSLFLTLYRFIIS